jgi:hypothetical protein
VFVPDDDLEHDPVDTLLGRQRFEGQLHAARICPAEPPGPELDAPVVPHAHRDDLPTPPCSSAVSMGRPAVPCGSPSSLIPMWAVLAGGPATKAQQ